MKFVAPLAIALLGLGAGVGAGLALRPDPHASEVAADCDPHGEAACGMSADDDPFKPKPDKAHAKEDMVYVPLKKPFIVPVFHEEKVTAMVVLSLSVAAVKGHEVEKKIEEIEPRLRDQLLNAMFRHANADGFEGSFTSGRKMEDLRSALLVAAREVLDEAPVGEVLITEIARQDV